MAVRWGQSVVFDAFWGVHVGRLVSRSLGMYYKGRPRAALQLSCMGLLRTLRFCQYDELYD